MLNKIVLITLILGFMIAIGVTVKAHLSNDAKNPHLYFESDPEITCDIDGKQFTHTRVTKDGKITVDFWHEQPRDPIFTITAEAHGIGYAYIQLYGDINGTSFGDAKNWQSEKLGNWFGLFPAAWGEEHDIWVEEYGTFKYAPKEYKWDADGTIELVPYHWQWRIAGIIPGGQWQPAPDKEHKELDAGADGSWTVDRNWSTEGSRSKEVPDNDDEEGGEGSEDQGNATPTVPDRPGSFDLTPYKVAIKLQWTDSDSDGGSSITDYQYQWKVSHNGRKRWSDWSSWTSAGTGNSTWLNGLYKDTDYAVRMRAVNGVGTSSNTGIQIVKTNK